MSVDFVSYDTNPAGNPAPRAEGGAPPVRYSAMLRRLQAAARYHEGRRDSYARLLADETNERERATLQGCIAREELAAEEVAAIWRVIWTIRTKARLREQLRDAVEAERVVAGEIDAEEIRYE